MSLNRQKFAISTIPIIHFVCVFLTPQPRKQFCISIVFIFYAKLFACVGEYETRRESVLWEMWKWRITVFKSKKKNLRIQKYPDTCGRGLSLVFNESERFWNSEMTSVYKPLVRPENVQTEDMIDITPIHTALLAVHRK